MKITIEFDTETDKINDHDERVLSALINDEGTFAHQQEPKGLELNLDGTPAGNAVETAADQQPVAQQDVQQNTVGDAAQPAETPQLAKGSKGQMIPYDARIHTSGDNKVTQKGFWAKRRGVDDLTVAKVEAELEGTTLEAPAEEQTAFELNANGDAVPAQETPATNPAPAVTESLTFAQLLSEHISPRVLTNPNFNKEILPVAMAEFGIGLLPELAAEDKAEILPKFAARLAELSQ